MDQIEKVDRGTCACRLNRSAVRPADILRRAPPYEAAANLPQSLLFVGSPTSGNEFGVHEQVGEFQAWGAARIDLRSDRAHNSGLRHQTGMRGKAVPKAAPEASRFPAARIHSENGPLFPAEER